MGTIVLIQLYLRCTNKDYSNIILNHVKRNFYIDMCFIKILFRVFGLSTAVLSNFLII